MKRKMVTRSDRLEVRFCINCDRNEALPEIDLCGKCYLAEQEDYERNQEISEW